mmetsp:Transcript_116841/g.342141  ORF Transcript_116841/g.342141 Transcript_116841/m.342141 type:complete len:501 (+) Transcript_116841:98-1600(+)
MASTGNAAVAGMEGECTLEVMVFPPRNGLHHYTLVYLHAFSSGFEGYTQEEYAMDYVRIVLPHAPYRPVTCYGNEIKTTWYDYLTDNGGSAEDNLAEETLDETRWQIFRLLDAERSLLSQNAGPNDHQSDSFARRLLIGGCSQGCAVALDVALRYPVCLAGFIGVVGHCLSSTPLGAHRGMPLHFFRKTDDQVMQWCWVQGTMERLCQAGYAHLHLHDPAPGGHWRISGQESGWIREAFGCIHMHHEPPNVDDVKTANDGSWLRRVLELTSRPREEVDIRPLLACASKNQASAQLVPVDLPWTSRLVGKVPLVCAVVEGLMSPEEADVLRIFVEQQRQNMWDLSQSHIKTAVDDRWGLTDELWSRMKHLLPAIFKDKHIDGLNRHLRFKRFGPGHFFSTHEDSSSTQSLGEGTWNISYLSAVLYLSDPGEVERGGRTRFAAPGCPAQGRCCQDAACEACIDAPLAKGSMVVYSHALMNADTEVKYGEEKFIMRTDVMYRR